VNLRDWQKNSWLVEHTSSPEEIAALFTIVERDLANAKVAGLADDWRLNIAYNAALQAATAALAASGFRAAREQHHYRTIQSLALTIGWPAAKVDRTDRFRKKRNIGGYETAGVVSAQEAREMHDLAIGLRNDVLAWLRKRHPKLLTR
jgi:hypothetical protein